MKSMCATVRLGIIERTMLSVLTGALLLLSQPSCSEPSGRIRDPNEESLVDAQRAGVVVQRKIIDAALKDLSTRYREKQVESEKFNKLRIFFAGVDNKTSEELGSMRHQMNGIINDRINAAGDFLVISYDRFVKPALDELGIRRDAFAIPDNRRSFAILMEQEGNPVDAVLYADLTQASSRAGNFKQSDYVLFFEILSLKDGTSLRAQGEVSKEYTR